MKGMIVDTYPLIVGGKLKVEALVKAQNGDTCTARMPERELSAILPRSILIGDEKNIPVSFLPTIKAIVKRMAVGRNVRLWDYRDSSYFSFLPWKGVTITPGSSEKDTTET